MSEEQKGLSDSVIVALIGVLGTFLVNVAGLIALYLKLHYGQLENRQAIEAVADKADANHATLKKVHEAVQEVQETVDQSDQSRK